VVASEPDRCGTPIWVCACQPTDLPKFLTVTFGENSGVSPSDGASGKPSAFQPKSLLWDDSQFSRKGAFWRPYEPDDVEVVLRANFQSFVVRKSKVELKKRTWSRAKLAAAVSEEFGIKYLGERVRQVFRGDREGRVSEYLLWSQLLGPGILPSWENPRRAFPPAEQVVQVLPTSR